jgi:hypothetical protein
LVSVLACKTKREGSWYAFTDIREKILEVNGSRIV